MYANLKQKIKELKQKRIEATNKNIIKHKRKSVNKIK